MQVSDDISAWEYRTGPLAKERTCDAMNAAHKNAERLIVSPIAATKFVHANMRAAEAPKPKLGGVYMLGSCARTFGVTSQEIQWRHQIIGNFIVVERCSTPRFDPELKLKEDYDFSCQHAHTYGKVLRCNKG